MSSQKFWSIGGHDKYLVVVESRDANSGLDARMIRIVGRRLREVGDGLNRRLHNDHEWLWQFFLDFLAWCFWE